MRQGRAALEEEARSGRPLAIEGIECQADPVVVLDIADWRAEPIGCCKEQVKPVTRWSGDDLPVGSGGHCGVPCASRMAWP